MCLSLLSALVVHFKEFRGYLPSAAERAPSAYPPAWALSCAALAPVLWHAYKARVDYSGV